MLLFFIVMIFCLIVSVVFAKMADVGCRKHKLAFEPNRIFYFYHTTKQNVGI